MEALRHGKGILMVDDDPDDFFIVREVLQAKGFENDIHLCADGEELMDYLRDAESPMDQDRRPMPGVILLDLNMPKINGRQVLSDIKANEALRHIPVVVLTTSSDPRDVDFCYKAGAEGYIHKSQSLEGLATALTSTIKAWTEDATAPPETGMDGR